MISVKGMQDTVTVWTDGKQYLVLQFCQLYPTEGDGNIISFSKFCSLRPKNVLLTGDTRQDQCKCMIHKNFFLKLEVLGHSYDKYESDISFGRYHPTYLLVACLSHSVWCKPATSLKHKLVS